MDGESGKSWKPGPLPENLCRQSMFRVSGVRVNLCSRCCASFMGLPVCARAAVLCLRRPLWMKVCARIAGVAWRLARMEPSRKAMNAIRMPGVVSVAVLASRAVRKKPAGLRRLSRLCFPRTSSGRNPTKLFFEPDDGEASCPFVHAEAVVAPFAHQPDDVFAAT